MGNLDVNNLRLLGTYHTFWSILKILKGALAVKWTRLIVSSLVITPKYWLKRVMIIYNHQTWCLLFLHTSHTAEPGILLIKRRAIGKIGAVVKKLRCQSKSWLIESMTCLWSIIINDIAIELNRNANKILVNRIGDMFMKYHRNDILIELNTRIALFIQFSQSQIAICF